MALQALRVTGISQLEVRLRPCSTITLNEAKTKKRETRSKRERCWRISVYALDREIDLE